jgi:uncharacterized membrane protein HdeD (DUF308 family)
VLSRLIAIAAIVIGVLELYGAQASGSPATFVIGVLTVLFGVLAVIDRFPYRVWVCLGLLFAAAALIAIGGLLFGAFGNPGLALVYTGAYVAFGGLWSWFEIGER